MSSFIKKKAPPAPTAEGGNVVAQPEPQIQPEPAPVVETPAPIVEAPIQPEPVQPAPPVKAPKMAPSVPSSLHIELMYESIYNALCAYLEAIKANFNKVSHGTTFAVNFTDKKFYDHAAAWLASEYELNHDFKLI